MVLDFSGMRRDEAVGPFIFHGTHTPPGISPPTTMPTIEHCHTLSLEEDDNDYLSSSSQRKLPSAQSAWNTYQRRQRSAGTS